MAIAGIVPSGTIKSTNTRYDIYAGRAQDTSCQLTIYQFAVSQLAVSQLTVNQRGVHMQLIRWLSRES